MLYCFEEIHIDEDLIDGNFQSSPLFDFALEIKTSLQAKHNLIGLTGLVCAIEITGRTALRFIHPQRNPNNADCFNFFMANYMGYSELIRTKTRIYDIVRNGMVHEGYVKEGSGFGTGYSEYYLNRLGLQKSDLRGIFLVDNEPELILDRLLLEFVSGLKSFHQDELRHDWKYSVGWEPDSSPWI